MCFNWQWQSGYHCLKMYFTNGYIEKNGCKVLRDFIGCFPTDFQPITKKQQFSLVFNLSINNEEICGCFEK